MSAQLYRPLSGPELIDLILKLIREKLISSAKFEPHVTYPNCQFYCQVQVHLPIQTDRDFTVEVKIDENPLAADQPFEDVVVEARIEESQENPADRIRDENYLPVTIETVEKGHAGMPLIQSKQVVRGPRIGRGSRQ